MMEVQRLPQLAASFKYPFPRAASFISHHRPAAEGAYRPVAGPGLQVDFGGGLNLTVFTSELIAARRHIRIGPRKPYG